MVHVESDVLIAINFSLIISSGLILPVYEVVTPTGTIVIPYSVKYYTIAYRNRLSCLQSADCRS